ncbi:MAG: acyltransferase [Smithellaceae bacterium]|nr:acyltransferase [Smithellaceae bacterium]
MRRDHRPYYLKSLDERLARWYAAHFLSPHFEELGRGTVFMKPWHVEVFGGPVLLGDYAHVIATSDKKVRFTVWSEWGETGRIEIKKYCLICPGVRISAARRISIGESCMLAQGVYITDADWHGIYDRTSPVGISAPVAIGDNVWIGDSAIICKGVSIGDNSIIGAGSVVVHDIPADCIAAGNPARVVKELDRTRPVKTRAAWLSDPQALAQQFREIDRAFMKDNTIPGWLRSLFSPRKGD